VKDQTRVSPKDWRCWSIIRHGMFHPYSDGRTVIRLYNVEVVVWFPAGSRGFS